MTTTRRGFWRFSALGLSLGLLFLCGALTPSLLPRAPVVQGVLGGLAFAVGYGVGQIVMFVWWALELPVLKGRVRRIALWVTVPALGLLTIITFARMSLWQDSIRARMEMPPLEAAHSWLVALIAVGVALVLILLARLLGWLMWRAADALSLFLPRRAAVAIGVFVVAVVVISLGDRFIVQKAFRAADAIFFEIDTATDKGRRPPTDAVSSGGPASILAWDDIGTNGKDFLIDGPDEAEIAEFWGQDAKQPVRVYAGFGAGEDFEERAALALRDLVAMGGFERRVLVVATPTGTGWLDPAAMQPLPYLHKGDLAIVSLQYTYVPSWMSILVEPDRSRRAARALFDAVYGHWRTLPRDERPELYVFGLSLGALGAEVSADLVTIFDDPIDGGLYAGPPFASTVWKRLVAGRNPGTPAWRPEFRDGRMVRFMTQEGIATPEGAEWGRMRLLYIQHASDPMVFFSPDLAFRRPAWLGEDRGPDVSPYFDWYPILTFLQVGFDIPMATVPPSGFGHTYDALEYIDGWIAVTQPKGWTPKMTERLKEKFTGFTASPI
ncbi:alpha/beta-hydrolase family protein [Roseovarius sp. SCSIO 43702]|uniref:alpha/beta hydrolase n=1 Tax=Roseovarius sp. SCSIO 43702 TaxID=2823043 RepID=UPI001C72EB7F|nr:alpha/beta-hydrolase family protein [Roseovarius sp. SCSIO 43702]QYX57373.1 alpha/beta-hydrolase family protein [Roseovarius sp. SCSIO 43702]